MKTIGLVLVVLFSVSSFAENNGLTGGGGYYDNYLPPAPISTPAPHVPPTVSQPTLKTCISADGVSFTVTASQLKIKTAKASLPDVGLSLQPDGTLVSEGFKYRVYLSSNILLIDNSLVVYCRG